MAMPTVPPPDPAIPTVDFSRWRGGTAPERRRIARELTDACRRVGFAYVVHHGVPAAELAAAFGWARRLFALPDAHKMLAPHPPGPTVHRGYSWPGLEKVSQYVHRDGVDGDADEADRRLRSVMDFKESFEIGSETFARQPNVWLPEDVLPGFRAFTTQFYWTCFATAQDLLRALALGLGIKKKRERRDRHGAGGSGGGGGGDDDEGDDCDEDYFLGFHSGHANQLRLLHYPAIATARLTGAAADLARMPAHSDWGSITLLFQDACGGLQVEAPGEAAGRFVDAVPVEGALVVNVGDLLMRWSNDQLKSTLHCVTVPLSQRTVSGTDGSHMTEARYSIPYFVAPDPESVIECLPACVGPDRPPKYPPITQEEYSSMRGRLQYSENPDVTSPGKS